MGSLRDQLPACSVPSLSLRILFSPLHLTPPPPPSLFEVAVNTGVLGFFCFFLPLPQGPPPNKALAGYRKRLPQSCHFCFYRCCLLLATCLCGGGPRRRRTQHQRSYRSTVSLKCLFIVQLSHIVCERGRPAVAFSCRRALITKEQRRALERFLPGLFATRTTRNQPSASRSRALEMVPADLLD